MADYRLKYEPFHGRWPAWLVRDVPGREAIKIHRGNRTDHSQGCIVLSQAKIDEILQTLSDNDIGRHDMRLSVSGAADFGFRIIAKSTHVARGGKLDVAIVLTGAMSIDGVSKDVWVHVNPDGTATLNVDFAPAHPQRLSPYHSSSSYPVDGPGFWVHIPEGQSSVVVAINIKKNET